MTTVRVAVASVPLAAGLEQAVPAAVAAVEEAGRLGAAILCLPETAVPGHRGQPGPVPSYDAARLDAAVDEVAAAARRHRVVTVLGTERPTPAGLEITAVVIGADGTRLGTQVKTQLDPGEEAHYVAGSGRQVFTAAGTTFGVLICHEAYRYPEIARSLVLAGAQVLLVPHWVVTDDGTLPTTWGAPGNPYHELALRLRAMENTVFVAGANCSGPDQGAITGVVAPDGRLVTALPYGETGVVAADLDLAEATRLLALRWAPDRSFVRPPG